MSKPSYISCIKIGGVPILPPLITPQIREECLNHKRKAIEVEKKRSRDQLFKKCMEDLERLEFETKKLNQTTLENQLAFNDDQSSPVPFDMYNKMKNLTSETIDVSEYSDEGVRLIVKTPPPPPKLIRSNSYTLDSPSPILLAHLEKEARKCVELDDDSKSSESAVTIIDNEVEPPLQVDETVVSVEEVIVKTPIKKKVVEPQLLEILEKLPQEHARNILEILSKQQDEHEIITEQFNTDDKSMSVSISSQSLYYSVLSSSTETPQPDLNIVNLKNIKNSNPLDVDKAASIIQAHVRGYLIRRLIQTEKVQGLIETIKDALLCAIQLHGSEVIEEADVELHRRLIQQVSAACYAFHDIFFTLSTKEQMGIIALDRQRKIQKANRPLSASSSSISLSSRRSSARLIR